MESFPRIRDIGLVGEPSFGGAPLAEDTAWLWTALEDDNSDALDIVGNEKLIELPLWEAFERVDAEDVRAGCERIHVESELAFVLAEVA